MITNAAANRAALRTARQRRNSDCLGVIDSLSPGEEEGFALSSALRRLRQSAPHLGDFSASVAVHFDHQSIHPG